MTAIPSLREVSSGLYGAWRLARLDARAMAWFDLSPEGTARSFWAAIICFPGFIALLALRVSPDDWAASGVGHILLVESIGYVVGWTAYPLAALALCRALGVGVGGFDFITAYNWSQIIETALFIVVAAVAALHVVPDEAAGLLSAVALILVLLYEWFIARVATRAGGGPATALVLTDLVLGAGLSRITQGLY
ncbi:MAG TPA: hypothetical protein VH020_14515 [Stellaceae bacterium]|jgi:hypothetical protein|nr:hypothetical protein [Stellaceae bacterium]